MILLDYEFPPMPKGEPHYNGAIAITASEVARYRREVEAAVLAKLVPVAYEMWGGPRDGSPIGFYGHERSMEDVESRMALHESWEWKVIPMCYLQD